MWSIKIELDGGTWFELCRCETPDAVAEVIRSLCRHGCTERFRTRPLRVDWSPDV